MKALIPATTKASSPPIIVTTVITTAINFEKITFPLEIGCTKRNFNVGGVHSPDTISLINTAIPAAKINIPIRDINAKP